MSYGAVEELESCIERFGDVFGAAIVCARTRTCLKVLRALAKSPGPLYTRQLLQLIGDVSWGRNICEGSLG